MQRNNWNRGTSELERTNSIDNQQGYYENFQIAETLQFQGRSDTRLQSHLGPDVFRNPSPPHFSREHHISPMSTNSISSPSSRENLRHENDSPENIDDPSDNLIEVNNRFSNMILTKESITQEENSIGFSKFHEINQIRALHCWQKQIGSSNRTSVNRIKVTDIIEEKPQIIDHKPVKTEEDEFTDIYAHFRCKKFLRGRVCEGHCQKIHRLPKEDGVKCISQRHGQCHQGRKCNFLHEVTSDDSESDDNDNHPCKSMALGLVLDKLKRGRNASNTNSTEDCTSTVALNDKSSPTIKPKTEMSSVGCADDSIKPARINDARINTTSNVLVHDSSLNRERNASVGMNSTVKIKTEPTDSVDPNHTRKCANSSSSSYSSTTTMTTSTTLSQSNTVSTAVKRKAQSPVGQRLPKREKKDETIIKTENASTNISTSLVHIKSEPPDLELFKEETVVEGMVSIGSHVKTENMNGNSHFSELTPTPQAPSVDNIISPKIVIPPGYVMASPKRLREVSAHICCIINEMECKKSEGDLDPTSDAYGKLCEFLHRNKVTVLSEVSNPKYLVWDVNIRLFFNRIFQVNIDEYLANIERHLADETFEEFMGKVTTLVNRPN